MSSNNLNHCCPTTVTRIDPNNMQTELVFAHDGKDVFGVARQQFSLVTSCIWEQPQEIVLHGFRIPKNH